VIFYLIINAFNNHQQVENSLKGLLKVLALIVIFLIYKFIIIFDTTFISLDIEKGSKFGKNSLAFFLTIFFAFSLIYALKVKKVLYYFITLILFTGILLTFSRTAWAVSILILINIFIINRNKLKFILVILLLAIPLTYFNNEELMERFQSFSLIFKQGEFEGELYSVQVRKELIQISIESINKNPIQGIGYGNYSSIADNISAVTVGVSHNDYLQVFVEGGIFSLLLLLLLIVFILIQSFKLLKITTEYKWLNQASFISLIAMIIYMFFINIFHSLYFWVLLSIIVSIQQLSKESTDGKNNDILRNEFSENR